MFPNCVKVLGLLLAFNTSSAVAQQYTPPHWVIHNPDTSEGIVWTSLAAHERGIDFVQSGATKKHPELLSGLIACVVANGTPVILDSPGVFSADITVIDGKHTGCSGNIASNAIELIH
jgi:hypothetical protein